MFPTTAAWSNAECSTEDFGKVTGIVVTDRRGNIADCKIRIEQEVLRTQGIRASARLQLLERR